MQSLGIQLYSVRDQLSGNPRAVLQMLAAIGYRAVEPYQPLVDPAGFRALTDEFNLSVPSTHGPVLGDQRDELAAAAGVLGVGALVVPAVPADGFADLDGGKRIAQRLNDAACWAAGHGLRLGYHNHHFEFSVLPDGRTAYDALVAQLSPEVFLEVDVYWAATAGVDVPDLLARHRDRIAYLHIKDGPAVLGEPMTAVGAGRVPVPEILAAAPPTAHRIVELDTCAGDVMAALAQSYQYLTES